MAINEPVVSVDQFLGIRNRQPSERLPAGALSEAENVDIDDSQQPRLRKGYSLVKALTNVSSAYATHDQDRMFVVSDGMLYSIAEDLTTTLLKSGLSGGELFWSELGDRVVYAGSDYGVIHYGNVATDLIIPTPAAPAVEVISGNLSPGRYQVTCLFVQDREPHLEGGAPESMVVELTDANKGLRITLPTLAGHIVALYASDINDPTLCLVGQFVGGAVVNLTENEAITSFPLAIEQQQTYPIPETCDRIAFFGASLYAASYSPGENQTAIFFSKPFWSNLFDLHKDYILIPGRVYAMAGTPSGLLIATGNEIFELSVDGSFFQLADYGVTPGRPCAFDHATGQMFLATLRGVCSYPPFTNHTQDNVSLDFGDNSATGVIDQGGFRRFVTIINGSSTPHNSQDS